MTPLQPEHGGADGGPPVAHDFSTNASPVGPPPELLRAVLEADRHVYPDPEYAALRRTLATAEGCDASLVLPTAGGSEGIRRLTLAAMLTGYREVWVPGPGYGDYAHAAQALGMTVHAYADPTHIQPTAAALVWACEPCNPTGVGFTVWPELARDHLVAVDLAYAPLQLQGATLTPPAHAWRLICPNKSLGLTGVRAGYLVAPAQDAVWSHVQTVAPSWVLSAEGEAMLSYWHTPQTQRWLADARPQLAGWAAAQWRMLASLDWVQRPSSTHFWLARPPRPDMVPRLRERGIRVRDAASFGLDGWVRVSAQPPAAQQALQLALLDIEGEDA